jgi:predicted DNA-binding transcriptional regulator AlpA
MDQQILLRLSQIIGDKRKHSPTPAIIPVSRATWYRHVRSGLFPKAVAISPRCVGWRKADIDALVSTLSAPQPSFNPKQRKPKAPDGAKRHTPDRITQSPSTDEKESS